MGMVSLARGNQSGNRAQVKTPRDRASAFEHRLFHSGRLCENTGHQTISGCNHGGAGRCATRWLRASLPRPTVLPRIKREGRSGRVFHLSAVRRNGAGQRPLRRAIEERQASARNASRWVLSLKRWTVGSDQMRRRLAVVSWPPRDKGQRQCDFSPIAFRPSADDPCRVRRSAVAVICTDETP